MIAQPGRTSSRRLAPLLLLALAPLGATAQGGPGATTRALALGPTSAQRESAASTLEFPFVSRADEEPTGATVRIDFAAGDAATAPAALEVLVNDSSIGRVVFEAGATATVTVPREALAPRNQLAIRALDRAGRPVAARGAWERVRSIRLELDTTPAPLPDDLALLPIPFVDRDFDGDARIELLLPDEATPEHVRLASLVASWIALDVPVPLSFDVHTGPLPDRRAVVLVDSEEREERLGLPPLRGSSVRMVDHPRHPGSNVKLLVVGGRSLAQLRTAAEALAVRSERLVGAESRLEQPTIPAAAPYSAPRWLPSGRQVRFAEFPLGGTPSHDGAHPTTLSVRFRVPPDLALWPADSVRLDLAWTQRLPPGIAAPRLDLVLNGFFVTSLPRPLRAGEHEGRLELRIPREHLRGFNELVVHVQYPPSALAATSGEAQQARFAISGDSVLHLEPFGHFISLPDIASFVYDGFPFTRLPDLAETAVVLPAGARPDEWSAVVTMLAQFAQVTGTAPTHVVVLPAEVADQQLVDRDLLVVGTTRDNALLARWRDRWPVDLSGREARVRSPSGRRLALELTGGPGPLLDAHRAREVVGGAAQLGAVMGIESPLSPGRAVIAVTSRDGSGLPDFRHFLGFAESRALTGNDLLVLSGDHRWMFRIGPAFERGRLAPWTRTRWFLANHWLLLLPLLGLGLTILGLSGASALSARLRERLAEGAR